MPRLARLDAPGVFHHILIRGIESRKIFSAGEVFTRGANSGGFSRLELTRIRGIIDENHEQLLEAWDDYFGG